MHIVKLKTAIWNIQVHGEDGDGDALCAEIHFHNSSLFHSSCSYSNRVRFESLISTTCELTKDSRGSDSDLTYLLEIIYIYDLHA